MGDVIGYLVQAGPLVCIRSADGVLHECRHADVVYVRCLTDRPVKNSVIRSLEHAAALAWPGREHQWMDGWMVRAGPGADLAANSAIPLDMFSHTRSIAAITDWYARRGEAPYLAIPQRLLRLSDDVPTSHETRAMVCDISVGAPPAEVIITDGPGADWAELHCADTTPVDVLNAVVDGEVAFAAIPQLAVGRGAVTEGADGTRWLGVRGLRVARDRRRRGSGRAIVEALCAWGASRGATRGYAHVASEDVGVVAFFEAAGFVGQHRTRYLNARAVTGSRWP